MERKAGEPVQAPSEATGDVYQEVIDLIALPEKPQADRIEGVVIGRIAAIDEGGAFRVDFPGNPKGQPLLARSTVAIAREQLGRAVALLFERGDPACPIAVGVLVDSQQAAFIDGSIVRENDRTTIRRGKASITLTDSGKLILRGEFVSIRSSGANLIQGGSVLIN